MTHKFGISPLVQPNEGLLENTGIYEILRALSSGWEGEALYRFKGATGQIRRILGGAAIVPPSASSVVSG